MLYVVHDRPDVISESLFTRACDHGFNQAFGLMHQNDLHVDIHFIDEKGEGGGTIDTRQEEDAILVEINKHQSVNNILLTLFHEIKHVITITHQLYGHANQYKTIYGITIISMHCVTNILIAMVRFMQHRQS